MGTVYPPPRRNDGKAVASLLLGVASFAFCLGALTGIPAIILGSLARRDIDRSDGTLTGRGLAAAGITSGLLGTGFGLVLAISLLSGGLEIAREPAGTGAPVVAFEKRPHTLVRGARAEQQPLRPLRVLRATNR